MMAGCDLFVTALAEGLRWNGIGVNDEVPTVCISVGRAEKGSMGHTGVYHKNVRCRAGAGATTEALRGRC